MDKHAFLRGFQDEMSKEGFTLIELMAALGITGAVGAGVGGLPGMAGGMAGLPLGALAANKIMTKMPGKAGGALAISALLGAPAGGIALGRWINEKLKGKKDEKRATEEEVQNIFADQGTDPEMPPMQPRNEGWRVVKEELTEEPGGMLMQKTTRVRTFGRLHKLAFVRGFLDEMGAKKAALKGAQGVPLRGFLGGKFGGSAKTADEKVPTLIEPHRLGGIQEMKDDPFYRLKQKLKIISGRARSAGAAGPTVSVQQRKITGKGLAL